VFGGRPDTITDGTERYTTRTQSRPAASRPSAAPPARRLGPMLRLDVSLMRPELCSMLLLTSWRGGSSSFFLRFWQLATLGSRNGRVTFGKKNSTFSVPCNTTQKTRISLFAANLHSVVGGLNYAQAPCEVANLLMNAAYARTQIMRHFL
jgi:hypothetical protein